MTVWTADRVAAALGVSGPNASLTFSGISTDSRALEPGSLFVALVGERFDGHDYLGEARNAGASGAVVRRGTPPFQGLALYEVADTLEALGNLARERRREVTGPVIAITGTNGKTATKELVAAVLGGRWMVHATRESRNNLVGVPLTLLEAAAQTNAFVIEAGANEPGEIAKIRQIVEPTISIITNVSVGHVQGFGSLSQTLEEKTALAEDVALAIVGTDPPELLSEVARVARRVVQAGETADAGVHPHSTSVTKRGFGVLQIDGVTVELPFLGRHQIANAMLAVAVARELEVPIEEVAERLTAATLPTGRCEVLECGELIVLHDAYNANPASVAASLQTADDIRGDRPLVVVLGTMLELGEGSSKWHSETAERVLDHDPHLVAVTGDFVEAFAPYREELDERLIQGPDPATLGRELVTRLSGNELVLLKASRGVKLEGVLPFIIPEGDSPCSTTS